MNKNMHSEKFLAIDYGTVRIGLAVSFGSLAEPYKIIAAGENAIAELKEIIASEQISKLIFGLSENEMAEKTKKFAQLVAQTTGLAIDFFDETLSSYEVTQKRATSKKSPRREHLDHHAAAQILQGYLDSQN